MCGKKASGPLIEIYGALVFNCAEWHNILAEVRVFPSYLIITWVTKSQSLLWVV